MTSVWKIEDSVPTTTINFKTFTQVLRKLVAENLRPRPLPDNEGTIAPFVGTTTRRFTFKFLLEDIGGGDTAADQRADLETMFQAGGDNDYLYTVTFDVEDSTDGSQTESVTGKMTQLIFYGEAGKAVSVIRGEFEFLECDE